MPRVPGIARRLLRLLLGEREAATIAPSLAELFALRVEHVGRLRARLWYWRQVVGCGLRARALRDTGPAPVVRRPGASRTGGDALPTLGAWGRDLRLALRSMRRRPGFAALAVVTLALGIGANTAIFSVLHGSLLRPLPYGDPDRLVWLSDAHGNFGGAGANQSVPNYLDLRDGSRLMASSFVYKVRSGNLSTDQETERIEILYASSGMFATLQMPLALGRDLATVDDDFGGEPVAILSDRLWRGTFGADPEVLGRALSIDGRTVEVVGVAPAQFTFPGRPDLIMGLQHVGAELQRGNRGHFAIARMAPEADLEGLRQELQTIYAGLVEAYPDANEDWSTWADPLRARFLERNRQSLLLMAGAAALVLLIACVNVANLMLVRAEARQRELAVRYSLGATRSGLLSLFVSEGLVLGVAGGLLGVLGAYRGVDLLVALYGDGLPRAEQIAINLPVLLFCLAVSVAAGVLVGLIPLARASSRDVHERLKEGVRGTSGRGSRLGRVLVVAEIATAVLIVVAAGLLTHSMWRLHAIELGVDEAQQVLTFRVSLPTARYPSGDDVGRFYQQLLDGLNGVAGVEAAGLVNRLPLLGGDNMTLRRHDDPTVESNFVSYRMVTAGYFEATGVRLLSGRLLDDRELQRGERGIVINRTLARQLFGTDDPVGRRVEEMMFRPGTPPAADNGIEIVGVIADIVGGRPDEPPPPAYYFGFAVALDMLRAYPQLIASEQPSMSALVRTAGAPYALLPSLRAVARRIDPEVPIFEVRTLAEIAAARLGTRRFAASLFGVFAALALLLGAVGIYGVMSYGVAQRSRELGVRMALGASRHSVLAMVLREGLRLTAPGLVIGLVAALAASRALGSLLYEVSPMDPATYGTVAAALALVCIVATWVPARRATRVDPLQSIREE